MRRGLIVFFLILLVGVIAGVVLTRANVLAAPDQPLPFSHRLHSSRGVPCLYCHSGALRSAVAGIPSLQLCIGCHNVIATERPAIQELSGFWEREEPIPWVHVQAQPEHVFFSHQPHLSAGLNCETCHGEIGGMEITRPVLKMDMGWCLECHLKQPEEKVARLADCLICHK